MDEKRAPVQSDRIYGRIEIPNGTISWEEHMKAWIVYSEKYGKSQSAERIAERHGFSYLEVFKWLGYKPETWRPL